MEIVQDWIEPVTGWTIAQLHAHVVDSQMNQSKILVLCQDQEQVSRLQSALAYCDSHERVHIVWEIANPNQLTLTNNASTKLTVATVASPDPTIAHWEDCCKPWVHALNMQTSVSGYENESRCVHGPRYLMPVDDAKWAVHEIIAADQAMRCTVVADELF